MTPDQLHPQASRLYDLARLAIEKGSVVTPTVICYDPDQEDMGVLDVLPQEGELSFRLTELASAIYLEGFTNWHWFFISDAWGRTFPVADTGDAEAMSCWMADPTDLAEDPRSHEELVCVTFDPVARVTEAFTVKHGRGDDGAVVWDEPREVSDPVSSLGDELLRVCDWGKYTVTALDHFTGAELVLAPMGIWLNMLPTTLGHRLRMSTRFRDAIDWGAIQRKLDEESE